MFGGFDGPKTAKRAENHSCGFKDLFFLHAYLACTVATRCHQSDPLPLLDRRRAPHAGARTSMPSPAHKAPQRLRQRMSCLWTVMTARRGADACSPCGRKWQGCIGGHMGCSKWCAQVHRCGKPPARCKRTSHAKLEPHAQTKACMMVMTARCWRGFAQPLRQKMAGLQRRSSGVLAVVSASAQMQAVTSEVQVCWQTR